MIVEAKCQFCQMPLRLIVDDDYARLEDPHKLYPLAACDRCADHRAKKRFVVARLKWICELLATKQICDGEDMDKAKKKMRGLLTAFVGNTARYRKLDLPDCEWLDPMMDALLAKPESLGDVLSRVPSLFRQEKLL